MRAQSFGCMVEGGVITVCLGLLQVMIGLGITYSVTGGQSLYRFWGFTCQKNAEGNCKTAFGQSAWIVSLFTPQQLQ